MGEHAGGQACRSIGQRHSAQHGASVAEDDGSGGRAVRRRDACGKGDRLIAVAGVERRSQGFLNCVQHYLYEAGRRSAPVDAAGVSGDDEVPADCQRTGDEGRHAIGVERRRPQRISVIGDLDISHRHAIARGGDGSGKGDG